MSRALFETAEDISTEMSSVYSACIEQFSLCSLEKSLVDKLVLDFFSEEGYYEPWIALSNELKADTNKNLSGELQTPPPVAFLKERSAIRSLLMRGDISEAITKINDLNFLILEKSPEVHFSLLQQKILETMHSSPEEDILEHVQEKLSPLVLESPELLPRLEEVLLQYIFKNPADIMKSRQKLARYINFKILEAFQVYPSKELACTIKESLALHDSLPSNSPLKSLINRATFGL